MKQLFLFFMVVLPFSDAMAIILITRIDVKPSAQEFVNQGGVLSLTGDKDVLDITNNGYSSRYPVGFDETNIEMRTVMVEGSNLSYITVKAAIRPTRVNTTILSILPDRMRSKRIYVNSASERDFTNNEGAYSYTVIISNYDPNGNTVEIDIVPTEDV